MTNPDEQEVPAASGLLGKTLDSLAAIEMPARRAALLYALPLFALLAWVALPLARGTETLFLRDVLNTHFPMKQAQAEAMRAGYFPILDPYRAGGQPLAGNPNAVPFYPTNLLYLVGSAFWALNAHFWIHLLLAPLAFFWMARSWGMAREPAWVASACYTLSGFFLSHMSFLNLIAAATLAPALIAACLDLAAGRRRALTPPVLAVLWGLLLLGGDPLMAALAGLSAGGALLLVWGAAWRARDGQSRHLPGWPAVAILAVALLTGTLLALPQLVEFARILPLSFRGHYGFSQKVATVASLDPRQIIDWLIPFAFGRPDLMGPGAFWGSRFYTDTPPYFLSLYPGLLTFALLAAAGRPRAPHRRSAWWAWGCIAFGIFVSLGRFNPLMAWVFGHQKSLRYPVKFWLPVAIGWALLCGLGFDRAFRERDVQARRRFALVLTVLAVILGVAWIYLSVAPGAATELLRRYVPKEFKDPFVANERLRWAGLCLLSVLLVGILGLLARIAKYRPAVGGAVLLAAHALAQILILRPLFPTDALKPYLVRPPALAFIPPGALVVNPDFNYLFGPSSLKQGDFPSPRSEWMERRAFFELYPFTGPLWKRRYDLNVSAEGLDSFLTRMAQGSIKGSDNEKRLRLLAAWGVDRLIMNHPLQPQPERAHLLATLPSFGRHLYIYEVAGRAPEAFLARRVFPAPHMNAAYAILGDPAFDPRVDAVLPGKDGPPILRGGGTVRIAKEGPESLEIDVEAGPGGSVLVVQRAYLLYRARLDGKPVPVQTANLHRLGLEVPAGRHHVSFRIDRSALVRSFYAVALGLALLPLLAAWGRRKPSDAGSLPVLARPVYPVLDCLEHKPEDAEPGDGEIEQVLPQVRLGLEERKGIEEKSDGGREGADRKEGDDRR